MFGLFKTECPVEENEKKWIEDSMVWLFSLIRKEENIKYKYISPKELFGGIKEFNPLDVAYSIQKKIANQLKITYPCTIVFKDLKIIKNDTAYEKFDYAGSYSLSRFENGQINIYFKVEIANDFALVARDIFYYLTLYKLRNIYNVDPKVGQQVDMATIIFGGYSYLANSLFLFEKWQVGRGVRWRYDTRGYLKESTCGYSIALLHYVEGVPADFSVNDLGRNVKIYYKKSVKHIKSHQNYYLDLANRKAIDLSNPPDFIYEHVTRNDRNQPSTVIGMKNFSRDGMTTEYYRNGVLKGKCEYKEGEIWTAISCFDKNGNQVEAGNLYQGNGTAYLYDFEGRLQWVFLFENGKKIKQDFYSYYYLGEVAYISEIKNDKRDGLTTYFHKNGKFWSEWVYKNDIPWTAICNYNNKGEKVEHGNLKEGNGVLFSYDDEGALLYKYHYENGELINKEACK